MQLIMLCNFEGLNLLTNIDSITYIISYSNYICFDLFYQTSFP